jgi:hypothetical protein
MWKVMIESTIFVGDVGNFKSNASEYRHECSLG